MTGATTGAERRTFTSAAYLATLMTDMDTAKISLRIRQARKDAGFRNRDQLADVMQVHHRTIENWEDPKNSNVPYDRMQELADVLNVDKRWLLHGDPEPLPAAGEEKLEEILRRLAELEAQVARSVAATSEAVRLLREAGALEPRARRPRRRAGTDSG